jgi:hypothetical protein
VLQSLLARKVINQGVGGQTSSQIAIRQGGVAAKISVFGGRIPSVGSVSVTFVAGYEPITSQGPHSGIEGVIGGVHGSLSLNHGAYFFTRSLSGTAVDVYPESTFVVDQPYLAYYHLIWVGRNDASAISRVESNIDSMIARLPTPKHFLILSVLNGRGESIGTGAYRNIVAINVHEAAEYPNNFLDVRSYLVTLYDPANANDLADHHADIPPSTLRYDNIHLNAAGYTLVAKCIYSWLQKN